MNITPETTYEAVLDHGTTGLAGTLRVRTIDNDGTITQAASSTGITEVAYGVYSAERTSPDTAGLFSLVWDSGTDAGVLGVETLYVTSSSEAPVGAPTGSYASVEELQRILKIRTPSAEQTDAMERVLAIATLEINAEIDLADDADALTASQILVCDQVCLDRAADLWHHTESQTGLVGLLGDDTGTPIEGRYSWHRYAHRLAPLKSQWGLA